MAGRSGCWPGSGAKDGPEAGGKVVGVRWEQADATAAVAGSIGGSARGLRDAALLAVMSDGLLRVSEAAALEAADLEAEGANTLTIRRSKTDQEGEGAVQYIRRTDGGTGPGHGSPTPGSPPGARSGDQLLEAGGGREGGGDGEVAGAPADRA